MEPFDLDIKEFCRESGLSEKNYFDLVEIVLKITAKDLPVLEDALAQDNFSSIRNISHRLGGAYLNLSINVIGTILGNINYFAKMEKEKEKIGELLKEFSEYAQYLEKEFLPYGQNKNQGLGC
ncbi:MAG: hypothetical protein KAJ18_09845 [Candidatus Omnitrophica bacterium]|nr:hypothetical protein [Candidatus Omnitrophota bacterium]